MFTPSDRAIRGGLQGFYTHKKNMIEKSEMSEHIMRKRLTATDEIPAQKRILKAVRNSGGRPKRHTPRALEIWGG